MKIIFVFFTVQFLFFNCSSQKQKKFSSGAFKPELEKLNIIYNAKNYPAALEQIEDLISRGCESGDLFTWYGYCLLTITKDYKNARQYYLKAVKWFQEYRTEFPEADNFRKAVFMLGQTYRFQEDSSFNLEKVKEVWDWGMALDKNNPYIKEHYPKLLADLTAWNDHRLFNEQIMKMKNIASHLEKTPDLTRTEYDKIEGINLLDQTNLEQLARLKNVDEKEKREIDELIKAIEAYKNRLR
ncbi:MAG: hypothetical protein A2096_16420 [Spirochaetes bacterium GWF1_41_5]|nr:MAG: hypothetical protein A2096_16420 [Spirochaetes bacterium GWF1_41_5]